MIQCPNCRTNTMQLSVDVHGVEIGLGLDIQDGEVVDSDKTARDPGFPVKCECLACGHIGDAASFGLDLSLEDALDAVGNQSVALALKCGWKPKEPDDLMERLYGSLTEYSQSDLIDEIMKLSLGEDWDAAVIPKKRLVKATRGYWESEADEYLEELNNTVRYFLGMGDRDEAVNVLMVHGLTIEEACAFLSTVNPMTAEEAVEYMNSK